MKGLQPQFFLAGNLNRDPHTLGLQLCIIHVGALIGTDRPEFIRIIQRICKHKTMEFENADIIYN